MSRSRAVFALVLDYSRRSSQNAPVQATPSTSAAVRILNNIQCDWLKDTDTHLALRCRVNGLASDIHVRDRQLEEVALAIQAIVGKQEEWRYTREYRDSPWNSVSFSEEHRETLREAGVRM